MEEEWSAAIEPHGCYETMNNDYYSPTSTGLGWSSPSTEVNDDFCRKVRGIMVYQEGLQGHYHWLFVIIVL